MQDKELFDLYKLCKRVHELTGWEVSDYPDDWYMLPRAEGRTALVRMCPIYTSDYLLEKLPASIRSKVYADEFAQLVTRKEDSPYDDFESPITYFAWYAVVGIKNCESDLGVCADTPLKSLLKLTLALKKSGGLK
jgi:hypothetical protein